VTQLAHTADHEDRPLIAQTLVKIFEAHNKIMELLEWAIREELSSSGDLLFLKSETEKLPFEKLPFPVDHSTVLREDSLYIQVIAQDFILVGGSYLRRLLRNEVMKIIRSPCASDRRVTESASLLLREICSSITYCPRSEIHSESDKNSDPCVVQANIQRVLYSPQRDI